MNIDANTLDDGASFDADVCIIGAGAAGITIAKELAGTALKVVLLESGDFQYEPRTQSLYEGTSSGLPQVPVVASRLRFFGGTTGHWSGWCAPLDSMDFERRAWIPHSGWPISRRELEPWYRRAEEMCQVAHSEYSTDYWEAATPAFKHLPLSPDKIITKIVQYSPPTRFGEVYRRELSEARNVDLWIFANATDICTTRDANHVTNVEVTTLSNKKMSVAAKHYILACGGMENARILLLSNKTQAQGLGNQRDLVGRFFMDHPHIDTSSMILADDVHARFYEDAWFKRTTFIPILALGASAQREHRVVNYSAALIPSRSLDPKKMFPRDADATLFIKERPGDAASQPDETSIAPFLKLNVRLEQVPNPDSRIVLDSNKRDALGQPQIRCNWQMTSLEKRTIEVAERLLAKELGRIQTGRLHIPDWIVQQGDGWPDFLDGGFHHMGTTRMSDSPRTGVVDAECRVHGIDNLYVAGSSVFPTSGAVNPTLTLVALAARLADHLKRLHK